MGRDLVHKAGLILVVAGLALASTGEAKRAFEIADHYRVAWVGAPELSPDGSRVAFTVRRWELDKGETWSEIWMMVADGSKQRQMTAGRHEDGGPIFSPDGKSLLFVSDRAGETTQLYVMPVDGGEARQLTDFPLSLSDPVFSPNGKWIAVTCEVYPECGADAECNQTIKTSREDGPLKVHLADELLYRHWSSWRDGRYRHILLLDAASGKVVRDLTPGRWDSPIFSLGGEAGYAFSPDSSELCYVSNHDPDPASSTNADLWLVSLAGVSGGMVRNLTAGNAGWDGDPVFSPGGRFLAFRSQATAGYESDLYRIGLWDRESGTIRYLPATAPLDNWVDAVQWTPGGDGLLLQVEIKGRTPLFRLELTDAKVHEVVTHGTLDGWQLAPDGSTIIYTRRTVAEPTEIFRIPATGGTPVRLTHFNAELESDVDLRPAEEIWVKGDGDYEVQVFLVKPHGFDPTQKYPLILNVHGGPQMQWTDSFRGDWQVYPGKGYVVAFPNPTGSAGFGQDFVDAIRCDWGGRVFNDLMKVTDALAALPWVDEQRLGAMGWSYGGYMMMWFEGHTDRFAALASMMGVYDLRAMHGSTEELWFVERDMCGTPYESPEYKRWSPSGFVDAFATPCLVITGERDYRVPYTQSLMFFTDLKKQQVPSRLVVFPDAGHWPSWSEMAFYYLVHLDWFHRWLGGEPAPWDVYRFANNQVFDISATADD